MDDTDLFAVESPEDGEIGYACVLGTAGEVFGLAVYLGREGFADYAAQIRRAAAGEDMGGEDALAFPTLIPHALLLTFENRGDVEKEDLERVARLGLAIPGRIAWPVFRLHEPGYPPWALPEHYTGLLSTVIDQALIFADAVRRGTDAARPAAAAPSPGAIPLRRRTADGQAWETVWHEPEERAPSPSPAPVPVGASRVRRAPVGAPPTVEWELGSFFAPGIVDARDGRRPYFPRVALWVERSSGIVLGFASTEPADFAPVLPEEIVAFIGDGASLPAAVRVMEEELFVLFGPLFKALGVPFRRVRSLPAFERVRREMVRHIARAKPR